jgi:hypothetical protein
MVSRDSIFEVIEELEESGLEWKDDILKYFSTDELKDFMEDFARLRDFDINWKTRQLEFDDEFE